MWSRKTLGDTRGTRQGPEQRRRSINMGPRRAACCHRARGLATDKSSPSVSRVHSTGGPWNASKAEPSARRHKHNTHTPYPMSRGLSPSNSEAQKRLGGFSSAVPRRIKVRPSHPRPGLQPDSSVSELRRNQASEDRPSARLPLSPAFAPFLVWKGEWKSGTGGAGHHATCGRASGRRSNLCDSARSGLGGHLCFWEQTVGLDLP